MTYDSSATPGVEPLTRISTLLWGLAFKLNTKSKDIKSIAQDRATPRCKFPASSKQTGRIGEV